MNDENHITIEEMIARLKELPAPPEIEVRDEEELPERPDFVPPK